MNKQTNLQPQVRLSINLREPGRVLAGGGSRWSVARVLPAIRLHWVGPAVLGHCVHTTVIVNVCVRAASPPIIIIIIYKNNPVWGSLQNSASEWFPRRRTPAESLEEPLSESVIRHH